MSRPILLTGFEPFADHAVNPTAEIARALDGRTIAGETVVGRVLPVSRDDAWPMLNGWLDTLRPSAVLATGVSNRPAVSLERIARNVDDYPIPDNTGSRVTAQPIVPDGPPEYRTTLALSGLRRRLGSPAALSDDAGTFLCNHVYYRLLHRAVTDPGIDYRSLFIHLPRVPDSGDPLEHMPPIVESLAWLTSGGY